jgi:hypothetical protein
MSAHGDGTSTTFHVLCLPHRGLPLSKSLHPSTGPAPQQIIVLVSSPQHMTALVPSAPAHGCACCVLKVANFLYECGQLRWQNPPAYLVTPVQGGRQVQDADIPELSADEFEYLFGSM